MMKTIVISAVCYNMMSAVTADNDMSMFDQTTEVLPDGRYLVQIDGDVIFALANKPGDWSESIIAAILNQAE